MLPRYLYRGDSDKKEIRSLRDTIDFIQFQTNLINGGNGREIYETPLLDLINKHVEFGWSQTHFLSFTTNELIAMRFGLHCEIQEIENKMLEYYEYFEQEKDWSFAVFTIDTQKIYWHEIDKGIYEGFYTPSLLKFKKLEKYKIICINVQVALDGQEKYIQSIETSKLDNEWLILPVTNITLNNNRTEYSAILDGACISEIKKYKHL